MAQASWQVRLKTAAGALAAVFSQEALLACHVTKVVNGVHTYALSIDATAETRSELFEVDGQVEVWRKPYDESWYKEFEGFHRVGAFTMDSDGRETYTSSGVGYQDWLARRVIDAAAGSAEAAKDGAAESVLKEYVDEQIVSATDADRQISGLTIEADGAGGDTVYIARPYRNLLEVCQEIAEVGGGDFDIVGTGAGTYELRWYDGQRGTDRRSTITFSTAYGNMRNPMLTRRPASASSVLVIGAGEGASRTTVWRPATQPTDSDRIEITRDSRDTSTTNLLNTRGDAALEPHAARDELRFDVVQTAAYRYGVDYVLGDLVSAYCRDTSFDLKIVKAEIILGDPDEVRLGFENV